MILIRSRENLAQLRTGPSLSRKVSSYVLGIFGAPKKRAQSAPAAFSTAGGTYVWLPAHKRLREHLAGNIDGSEYLLTSNRKTRYTDESLTRLVCEACAEVGFPGYSPHGLRHLAGAALAESGCSVHEIMSVLGHVTENEAMEYVRQANRKKMAGDGNG